MTTTPEELEPFWIKLAGVELADDKMNALVDLHIDLGLDLTGRCTLRFFDPDFGLAEGADFAVDKPIEVKIGTEGATSNFVGVITGLEVEWAGVPHLVVTAYDRSLALAYTTVVDTYLNQSYSDIISTAATQAGLSKGTIAGGGGGGVEYVLQAETWMEMVDAICERTGWNWWMSGDKLNVTEPALAAPVVSVSVQKLDSFSVRATAARSKSARVDGWDSVSQRAVQGNGQFAASQLSVESSLATKVAVKDLAGSPRQIRAGTLGVVNADEATEVAGAIMKRSASAAVIATGEGGWLGKLRLGDRLEVTDGGPLKGKYLITRLEHFWTPGGIVTRFTAGDRGRTALVDVLGERSIAAVDVFTKAELVVGKVTNVNDPDKRGRVKVYFAGLDQAKESHWARVATIGGGDKRGMVFTPEVKDEVLVGFENGDIRRPVVLGGLYGATDSIPEWHVKDGKVMVRRLTSRSGHLVELSDEDSDDKSHVLLQLKDKKYRFRLGMDKADLELPAGKPLTIKVGTQSTVTLDGNGKIEIKGKELLIDAQTKIEMKSLDIMIKADKGLVIEGGATLDAKAPKVAVNASALAEIKGNPVKIN